MSKQWIDQSKILLKTMDVLSAKKNRDRLEIINTMIFALDALNNSINGWRSWIQNLGFMSRFSEDELKDIEDGLLKFSKSFVEYDVEVTQKHQGKIPEIRFTRRTDQKRGDSKSMIA